MLSLSHWTTECHQQPLPLPSFRRPLPTPRHHQAQPVRRPFPIARPSKRTRAPPTSSPGAPFPLAAPIPSPSSSSSLTPTPLT
uniref:Uncharacterized protein n=1 Tax=Triticum urartu TaxID=4572 RepID=A0A8R7QEH7_TRIUA